MAQGWSGGGWRVLGGVCVLQGLAVRQLVSFLQWGWVQRKWRVVFSGSLWWERLEGWRVVLGRQTLFLWLAGRC